MCLGSPYSLCSWSNQKGLSLVVLDDQTTPQDLGSWFRRVTYVTPLAAAGWVPASVGGVHGQNRGFRSVSLI